MNSKMMTKTIAAILAFLLSFANVALLGSYASKTLAASAELEEQTTSVEKSEIEFDAYFQEEGKNTHSKIIDIQEGANLSLSLKVEDGYLANGQVTIENANFKLQDTDNKLDIVQSISSDENKIVLNQINRDESVVLDLPIKINTDSSFNVNDLDKTASVKLSGKYVNNKGKEIEVNKTIEIQTILDGNVQSYLNGEVSKYVTFDVNGEKGVILQTLITSNLINNALPVKTTKLEIEIPVINNIEPKTITLSAKSLMATTGKGARVFSEDEYKIEDGKIILSFDNNEEIISWVKNSTDEIILTCIYGEEAIVKEAEVEFTAKSEITAYGQNLKTVSTEINGKLELKEQIGDIVTLETKTDVDKLHKGYMIEKDGKATSFVNNFGINIGYHELIDNIAFEDKVAYIDEYENEYPSKALYTYLKMSKGNIQEILGEDGYINVYSESGEIITTLNKENAEYTFEEKQAGIKFETSKPINEGVLEMECGREINPLEYSKEQLEMFGNLKVTLDVNVEKDGTVIINGNESKIIELLNPEIQAELKLGNSNLSTVVKNEGVELRVTLKTTDASSKLYKNPEVTIELPNYITNVDIENVSLVYEKELKITSAQMYKNDNGNIVINIKLEGEQTKHNEDIVTEGATLVMKADITVNELTPTSTHDVKLTVKNNKGQEEKTEISKVNFVAPAGIATVSQVTESNDTAVSISGQVGTLELETGASEKKANVRIIAINNYNYDCDNVVILGRTPSEGNKGVTTNKELGSTFSADMISEIKSENGLSKDDMKVYYSENGAATSNLSDTSNGWTEDINEVEEVSSYMIVLNEDYKVKTGDIMAFNYDVKIPENLHGNEETYAAFAMYFDEASEEETQNFALTSMRSAESTVALTTPEVAELSVRLEASVTDKAEVEERTLVKYTAYVTNEGTRTADNAYLLVKVPSKAVFVDPETGDVLTGEQRIAIGSILPGTDKSAKVEFTLKMGAYTTVNSNLGTIITEKFDEAGNVVTTEEKEITGGNLEENKVSVSVSAGVEGQSDVAESNILENTLTKGTLRIDMKNTTNSDGYIYADGKSEIRYALSLKNENTKEALTGVKVTMKVPEGFTFKGTNATEGSYTYNETNKEIIWDIGTLNGYKYLDVTFVADELENKVHEKTMDIIFTATCDQSTAKFNSNTIITKSYSQGFTLTQSIKTGENKISGGETVIFNIVVTNLAPQPALFSIKDTLPGELNFVQYKYTRNGETTTGTNMPTMTLDLDAGEQLSIDVVAKAKNIKEKSRIITNVVTLDSAKVQGFKAEDITLTLMGSGEFQGGEDNPDNPDDPNNPNKDKTYMLSGTAWLDANRDGERNSGEELLPRIKVYLLDSTTKKVVDTATTNANGVYTFRKVKEGSYVVVFEYDTVKYDVTTYNVEGVDESVNSDAIVMEMTLEGKKGKYAVTNTIVPTSDIYNIDLGLVNSPKFDLELKKGVSLIQVSNKSGTQSYTFNKTDSAQVQIAEKYMNGSVVAITYTMSVTNTGAISGYANKIVDYKAKDLSFNSTLNPEWYQDTDGNLYTTSLSGREIKPGETVEVSLILTKTMTNNNIGVSNNTAEICEASNDLGIPDIDSTPGNRKSSEDDYGLADVFITLKTGGILFYGGIFLVVLAIFALGAYEINKKVLKKI